ncbi:ATP-binding protein [Mycolicibacterium tusciae]|uniref:ATP-binding protein n=1 Tax=Mycolicibacterium tusciae TaxID=75922 RepID=UPI0002DE062F|nr:BTAD domain-containing putative transcriptional regulator [Mycolicibacterium tusciae]
MSTGDLIDLMWGEQAPDSALNVIHKYIGALRRVFEPSVPARSSGSHLYRRGNGYLFTSGSATLDWDEFRELVASAKSALADDKPEAALDHYVRALELWKGAAGDGLDTAMSATAVFFEINTHFFDACATAAELAISLSSPQRVLAPLRLAAAMAPFNEPVHAALISLLGAAGQQAEALALFRSTSRRLADELGIDPGHALQRAHQEILNPKDIRLEPVVTAIAPRTAALVGRVHELAAVHETVDAVVRHGPGLVLLEGEPGVGKTTLLEESAAIANRAGAVVAWGNCPPSAGTPAMWPWVQAIGMVLEVFPEELQRRWRVGEIGQLLESAADERSPVLPDSGARFRLFERVTEMIGEAAGYRPVMLAIDDLHWADLPSLELFAHLASRLPDGVVLVGALRDRTPAPRAELIRMLAATSRVPGVRRIRLDPLSSSDVAELVHIETGCEPSDDAVRSIHGRTAGNPFFVRELSRLLTHRDVSAWNAAVLAEVPITVRDVVLDRLTDLADEAKSLLFIAALIGRDVDLRVLAHAAGIGIDTCLDRLEPLDGLGVLVSTADPYAFRFAHDLVRDAVVGLATPHQATRLHARIADALESCDEYGESVDERLAHHLWAAGPRVAAGRTADALMRAARRAANKFAFEAAEQNLRTAMDLARKASLPEVELTALAELTALVGMRSMYGDSGLPELLERAEHLAISLGRERDAAGFLYSRWAAHAQAIELDASHPLAQRLLKQGCASAEPVVRSYGFQAWGIQQWDAGHIGEAYRFLDRSKHALLDDLSGDGEDPVHRHLQWLMTGMLAETTALHGDIEAARHLLDILESAAGNEPYMVTVWAAITCRTASIAGDPQWASRVADRGISVDPGFNFVFLGTYLRLAKCWATAMTGDRPADAAAEAEQIITANLLDPPRSCVATWYALLAEMWIEAERYEDAANALDRAEWCLQTYGQRYAEGLLLLMRARLLQSRGAPFARVHAAALHAQSVSVNREAHLFAQRAQALLDQLLPSAGDGAA